jgi:hypothetical protein
MTKCKVSDINGKFQFDYECDSIPERGTAIISQDGRYLLIESIRRKMIYNQESKAYRNDEVDIVVEDMGGNE